VKSLRLPQSHLKSEKLALCFLMGYFDGDGNERDCVITSGAKEFLLDIKREFYLKYDLMDYGTYWKLNLGAPLFKRMMAAYPDSMPRKRKTHAEGYLFDIDMRQPNKSLDRPSSRKFDPTPDELEKLVWEMPATKLGEKFGVSGRAIKKRCKKYNIDTPGRGYWQKRRSKEE